MDIKPGKLIHKMPEGRVLSIPAGSQIVYWDIKNNSPSGWVNTYNHRVRPKCHSIVIWDDKEFAVWGQGKNAKAIRIK